MNGAGHVVGFKEGPHAHCNKLNKVISLRHNQPKDHVHADLILNGQLEMANEMRIRGLFVHIPYAAFGTQGFRYVPLRRLQMQCSEQRTSSEDWFSDTRENE